MVLVNAMQKVIKVFCHTSRLKCVNQTWVSCSISKSYDFSIQNQTSKFNKSHGEIKNPWNNCHNYEYLFVNFLSKLCTPLCNLCLE